MIPNPENDTFSFLNYGFDSGDMNIIGFSKHNDYNSIIVSLILTSSLKAFNQVQFDNVTEQTTLPYPNMQGCISHD